MMGEAPASAPPLPFPPLPPQEATKVQPARGVGAGRSRATGARQQCPSAAPAAAGAAGGDE